MLSIPRIVPISLGMVRAYLIVGERPILVDAGPPRCGRRLLRAIEAHGVDPGEIALVVLTHAHADHFGGLAEIRALCGAPVAVHRLDAEALQRGANAHLQPIGALGQILRLLASEKATVPSVDADIIVDDELGLNEFGVAGRVIWTPGHTPGSLSVVLESGEIIIGDLLMGDFVRRHRPNLPFFAHDVNQIRHSLARLLALGPRRIHTAHGREFGRQSIIERLLAEVTEGEA
jgi:glyoxylase-like metal-dependent hydrolase (beta-lactamase superfamily II)